MQTPQEFVPFFGEFDCARLPASPGDISGAGDGVKLVFDRRGGIEAYRASDFAYGRRESVPACFFGNCAKNFQLSFCEPRAD